MCGSDEIDLKVNEAGKQRYLCLDCNHAWNKESS
jgi:transposase-like protein